MFVFSQTSIPNWLVHFYMPIDSGVRRKFPRGGPSFVTIVWRHKSTLGKGRKARPF